MRFLDESESLADGQFDDMIEVLRTIAFESPDLPSTWVQLAESLEESGALSEAGEAWRMAHRLVPNSPRISVALRRLEAEAPAHEPIPDEPTEAPIKSQRDASVDIDLLISDLQSGRGLMAVDLGEPETDVDQTGQSEDEEIATETLAGIFVAQNLFADAVRIYDLLADREENAGKIEIFRARAEDLRKRSATLPGK